MASTSAPFRGKGGAVTEPAATLLCSVASVVTPYLRHRSYPRGESVIVPLSVTLHWSSRRPLRAPTIRVTWDEEDDIPLRNRSLYQEHAVTVTPTKEYVELLEDVIESLRLLINDAKEDYPDQATLPIPEDSDDGEFGSAVTHGV